MDHTLLEAFVPPKWSVLGVELRPFSLGHRVLLLHLGNPFVGEATEVKPADIVSAVQICARTWEDGLLLCSDTRESDIAVRCHLRKLRNVDWQKAADTLAEYIEEGSSAPGYSQPSGGGGVGRWTPWEQIMRVSLIRDLRLSESEVMNRHLALSWWDFLTLREDSGQLSILTSDEQSFADEMFKRADDLCQGQQN